eukprot:g6649.t1
MHRTGGLIQQTQFISKSKRFGICCSFGFEGLANSAATSLPGALQSVSTLLSSFSLILGLFILTQQLLTPEQQDQDKFESRETCPRCNGTGLEPCLCTRWSDGDIGCPSCNQTGFTKCKACGGGGKAVPLSVYVKKDNPSNSQPY